MRCFICGEKTEKKILCKKHMRATDAFAKYVMAHTCHSFIERENIPGMCQHNLLCEPLRRALKGETLIDPNLGHVVCPYAVTNLARIIYQNVDEKEIKPNYPECLD